MGSGGIKHDEGKVPLHQGLIGMFPRACALVAKASAAGAGVYGWQNWRTVPDSIQRYRNAAARHEAAIARGEEFDPGSDLPHAAHVAWNCLAVLELEAIEREAWVASVGAAVKKAKEGSDA